MVRSFLALNRSLLAVFPRCQVLSRYRLQGLSEHAQMVFETESTHACILSKSTLELDLYQENLFSCLGGPHPARERREPRSTLRHPAPPLQGDALTTRQAMRKRREDLRGPSAEANGSLPGECRANP